MNQKDFGISFQHHEEIKKIFSKVIRGSHQTIRVFIFGSRALGTYRKYSDVDLLLEAEPPLTEAQIESLKEAFEESDIPYTFDIVCIQNLKAEYAETISKQKVQWFEI